MTLPTTAPEKLRLDVGDVVRVTLPFSEVCDFLGLAGRQKLVRCQQDGAQILDDDGTPFSFPVLHAEAGLFCDANGYYTYDAVGVTGV